MKVIKTELFVVRAVPATKPELRIIVPKSVARNAVQRNRIRRRVREAFINTFSTSSQQFTLTALPSILGKSLEEIKAVAQQITKKA